jgi:hypothetical protein
MVMKRIFVPRTVKGSGDWRLFVGVRVLDYRSIGLGSIPGTTRFSEK